MDARVRTNSICNELVFIFHEDKTKDRRATYVRAVCDIRPQKEDTHKKILTAGKIL